MEKTKIQQRVLKDGKPLALDLFSWDEETRTFSSQEYGLVLDFKGVNSCAFKTGYRCTFKTGYNCTFDTLADCTFSTGNNCTFSTGSRCAFKTQNNCTFKADYDCVFDTGNGCIFDTLCGCAFATGDDCTFDTLDYAHITAGKGSVIVYRAGDKTYTHTVWVERQTIQTHPDCDGGFVIDGMYKGKPHIIADGILSEVLSRKGDVWKVINHGEKEPSWLVGQDGVYAHGATLQEAKADLIYKLTDKDTSAYDGYTLDTVLPLADCIKMYRTVTGACAKGVKGFVERQTDRKDEYSLREVLEITKGVYGSDRFKQFMEE